MLEWKCYHKQQVLALFKKNDRRWGVVSDEELVLKNDKCGGIQEYTSERKRPLYLALLKIAQQMVAAASWPNTLLPGFWNR